MSLLIGKNLELIEVNEDQHILKFNLKDSEPVYWITEGDCCSETWFADIVFMYKGGRQVCDTVKVIETLEVPNWLDRIMNNDGRGRQEWDSVYGIALNTDKTIISIVFRNSSNGYYGGSYDEYTHSQMLENKRLSKYLDDTTWTQITKDWRAE